MNEKKYTEDDILQFYNLIGLDEEELTHTRRHFEEGMDIENLMDLYNISSAKYILPTSSKEIAERYTVLQSMINDDFWIETSAKRRRANKDTMTILENVSSINVLEENVFNPEQNFLRVNEILKTALLGLCSCDNPSRIEWITSVKSTEGILNKKILKEENKHLRMLYELVLLSKLPDTGVDHLIFDENNKIDEERLLKILQEKISNNEKREDKVKKESTYTKKLQFRRPTLKELRNTFNTKE